MDIRQATSPELVSNQVYQDQVSVSDVLIGTKEDIATDDEIQAFDDFASESYPPKAKVSLE